eukprot:2451752-Pleurochrysis_carterae.AAC.2
MRRAVAPLSNVWRSVRVRRCVHGMHVCTFAGMCTRARACTHRHHGSSSNVRSLARAATEVGKQHHRRVLRAPQFVKLPVPVLAASQKRSARVEEGVRALGARRVLEIGARFGVGGRRVERGHQESTAHAAHLRREIQAGGGAGEREGRSKRERVRERGRE